VASSPDSRGSSEGRRQAVWLLAVALATTALFASGSVDIVVAGWFHQAGGGDHWPLARQFPWTLLYRAAGWITALLVIAALAALAASFIPPRRHWRRAAVLWAVPEGTRRAAGGTVWASRFGVVGLSMWGCGTTDAMNTAGLAAHLRYLGAAGFAAPGSPGASPPAGLRSTAAGRESL